MMGDVRDSILRFLLLPLLLEFLNSFRSYGLQFVLYNHCITNEFGIVDTDAGYLLGIKGFADILFAIWFTWFYIGRYIWCTSCITGIIIRGMIGRTVLAFGRSKTALCRIEEINNTIKYVH